MTRILVQTLTVIAVATGVLALTPACADNDQSIFIQSALAPSLTRTNGVCSYTSDPTQPALFEGTVDVLVRDSYSVTLLVGSEMIPRGDANNARAEPNRSHLNGAIVRVTDPNNNAINEFTSLGSGFVDVSTQNTPAFGSIAVTIIDQPTKNLATAGLANGDSRLVLANIKVFGKTLGGIDLESAEFQFPIKVCKGCLLSFVGADDPATPGIDCNLPPSTTSGGSVQQAPCSAGQDETTSCTLCLGRTLPDGSKPCNVAP